MLDQIAVNRGKFSHRQAPHRQFPKTRGKGTAVLKPANSVFDDVARLIEIAL
jgi:hypothetical protein